MCGELGQYGSTVGAAGVSALGEEREVAASGHRRDVECLFYGADAHAPLVAKHLEDETPSLGRDHGPLSV